MVGLQGLIKGKTSPFRLIIYCGAVALSRTLILDMEYQHTEPIRITGFAETLVCISRGSF